MALIVEDGTGLSTANTYVSLAEVDAYFTLSATTTWTGTDDAKNAAIIRSARALDGMFTWPGVKLVSTQALQWPRSEAIDTSGYTIDGVPQAVKNAQCEAALIELVSAGSLTPELDRGGAVIREKIGPLETEYASNAPSMTVYNTIKYALASILPYGGLRLRRG